RDRSAQSPTGQRLAGRLSACRPAPRPRRSNGRAPGLSWGRHNTGQSRRSRVVAAPRSHPAFEGARKWSNPLATAGDDPGVARDLLRRYGPDCRAVRAEWGPQVLEAPQEMKLRMTPQQLPPPAVGLLSREPPGAASWRDPSAPLPPMTFGYDRWPAGVVDRLRAGQFLPCLRVARYRLNRRTRRQTVTARHRHDARYPGMAGPRGPPPRGGPTGWDPAPKNPPTPGRRTQPPPP